MTAHTATARSHAPAVRPPAAPPPATTAPPAGSGPSVAPGSSTGSGALVASGRSAGDARASISLPPTAASARAARRFVSQVLAESDDALVDSAVLLVSELVTNAVVHGDSAVRLVVDRESPRGVRIEVHDGSDAAPRVAGFDPDALSGRGMALVDAVSDRWGVDDAERGKRVWFELSPGCWSTRRAERVAPKAFGPPADRR